MARRHLTHAIAEIRFMDDESSLICQCGWDDHDSVPEDLAEKYQRHREAVGQPRRSFTELLGNTEGSEFMRDQRSGRAISRKKAA